MLGEIQTPNTRTCWKCAPESFSLYAGEQLATEFDDKEPTLAKCHPCPEGAECRGKPSLYGQFKVKNSWWRSSNLSTVATQCFEQVACLGARNTDSRLTIPDGGALKENNESCAEGYTGRLCHACSPGFGRETFDSCQECPPSESNKALMAVGICMVIVMLVLFIIFTVKSADDEKSTSSMMFKTLAAYGQVVGIASLFPYKWPASVLYLFDVMESLTSVSDRILNTDCAMETTNRAIPLSYEKAILYMVGPLCFVGGATFFWLIVHCVMRSLFSDKWKREHQTQSVAGSRKQVRRKKKSSSLNVMSSVRSKLDNYKGEEWTFKDSKRYLIVSCLVAMVILHPTLTRQSLFMFMCVNIEDGTYLRKDVQLECYTSEHFAFLFTVGIPGVIGYVIGIPVVTFWVLYRRRFKLNIEGPAGEATRKTYGFIYQGYGIFYWEVVIMLRKVSMVIVAVFGLRATVQTQALMALLVVLLAAAAHVQLKPFDVQILDKLELYGLLTGALRLFVNFYFSIIFGF